MSEVTLRASTNVLAGTDNNDWPMIAHAAGGGSAIPTIEALWNANNMQYAGVLICSGGQFSLTVKLLNASGENVTPLNTRPSAEDLVLDGTGYGALLPATSTTPPAIGGGPGYKVAMSVGAVNGPWPAAVWEVAIFERIPYDPPPVDPGGGGGGTANCPERPLWPYLGPSITAYQGPSAVTRGARR